jgi:hypothetical protein
VGVISPGLVVDIFFGSQCSLERSISSFYQPVVSSRPSRKSCSSRKDQNNGQK